jgi:hypothetical protein
MFAMAELEVPIALKPNFSAVFALATSHTLQITNGVLSWCIDLNCFAFILFNLI